MMILIIKKDINKKPYDLLLIILHVMVSPSLIIMIWPGKIHDSITIVMIV
jgi:hypothetical protein